MFNKKILDTIVNHNMICYDFDAKDGVLTNKLIGFMVENVNRPITIIDTFYIPREVFFNTESFKVIETLAYCGYNLIIDDNENEEYYDKVLLASKPYGDKYLIIGIDSTNNDGIFGSC